MRERDFALDYEACMIAVQNLNSFAEVIRKGSLPTVKDCVYRELTREDVVPTLMELKGMIDRMFDRMNAYNSAS